MFLLIAFIYAITGLQINHVAAIECYSCTNTSSLPSCNTVVKCPIDSTCSSQYTTIQGTRYYTLGCTNVLTCPKIATVSTTSTPILVGRAASNPSNCSECCHANNCNRQLCQDEDPSCADDKSVYCANVGTITNICDDASHIKPYCRRFCGFCNTIDGGWAHWSSWSLCDVTCGNGTRTQTRTCTDPAPANGGSDCVGEKAMYEPCVKDLCPVHGGWSKWSEWGSCSVSCDVGLQRRDRTCSNPFPARNGDHCFGDSRSDRLCNPGACANGSWSSWGTWGACTVSCGGGVMTRTRNCDNPPPSMTGRYCDGVPVDSGACNTSSCQDSVVFLASHLSTTRPGANANLVFTQVQTNVGNGYNISTGYFTAPVEGTYSFNVQICPYNSKNVEIEFYVNSTRVSHMQLYGDAGNSCRTMSVPVMLQTGDEVHVRTGGNTYSSTSVNENSYTSNTFSGTLN